ncbi:MAG: exosortase H [Bacteroidota bacterium]
MAKSRAERRRSSAPKPNAGSGGIRPALRKWWNKFKREKSPVLIFLLRFSAVIVPFYILWWTDFFKAYVLAPWNKLNAAVAGGVLNVFGAETTASGVTLSSETASISVMQGCDGIEPTMLLLAGVLAFPAPPRFKIRGILYGSLFLLGTNFLRIISLFLAAEYWPAGFEFLHREFWQVVFILLAILAWGYWLSRLPQPKPLSSDAQLQTD